MTPHRSILLPLAAFLTCDHFYLVLRHSGYLSFWRHESYRRRFTCPVYSFAELRENTFRRIAVLLLARCLRLQFLRWATSCKPLQHSRSFPVHKLADCAYHHCAQNRHVRLSFQTMLHRVFRHNTSLSSLLRQATRCPILSLLQLELDADGLIFCPCIGGLIHFIREKPLPTLPR